MTLLQELIEYYVNLLIIQYNNKPKARAHIAAIAENLLANAVYFSVRDGYDCETAVGVQLDVLGKYADVDRFYRGQDFEGFFGCIIYDEVDAPPADRTGLASFSDDPQKEGEILTYPKTLGEDFQLSDDDFRQILKLRIIQNNSDHSHLSIDSAIFEVFGENLRPDSAGNMRLDYFFKPGLFPLASVAFQKGALPRPAAVRLGYLIAINAPFFGFATYDEGANENTEGFATFADYGTKEGETLRYLKLLEA